MEDSTSEFDKGNITLFCGNRKVEFGKGTLVTYNSPKNEADNKIADFSKTENKRFLVELISIQNYYINY